jgi:hypothetical protein
MLENAPAQFAATVGPLILPEQKIGIEAGHHEDPPYNGGISGGLSITRLP